MRNSKRKRTDPPTTSSSNGSSSKDGSSSLDKDLVNVEEDYYAIEKIVGWKGRGHRRQYKVRWKSQTLPGTVEDSWENPQKLSHLALIEAQELVRNDRRNGFTERQNDLECPVPALTNDTAEEHAKPAAQDVSTPTNNEGKGDTTSNELIGKEAEPTTTTTTLNPEVPVADSDDDSEVQFLGIRSVAPPEENSCLPSPCQDQEPDTQLHLETAANFCLSFPSQEDQEPEIQLHLETAANSCLPSPSQDQQEPETQLHLATAANSCLPSPTQDQEPEIQLQLERCGSRVLWVEEADPTTVPYADPSHFRRFVPEIKPVSRPPTTGTPKLRGVPSMREYPEDETNQEYSTPNDLMTVEELIRQESDKGNDLELVHFQEVERIDVNDEGAGPRVSEMRRYGIPFVLIGHPLWPAFASRWIQDVPTEGPAYLVIENLIADIGEEDVPIVEKDYDEHNPVKSVMKASDFLQYYWFDNNETWAHPSHEDQMYMQQWQFTSSPVAEILCGDDDCRPPDVLHEDLVSHWLNDGGNPYQYLFMGSTGTMSKLHKDPGGLDILIAPIVGEKECVLVHRDDGKYLYDCRSNLDEIDLNRFPLTECARIWKTVVKAGELLFMPHDTYHQCRNVTPCMSYHRLHLDYVNLPGFLDSLFQQDSSETIEHEEILWNCAYNLCEKVDDYVEEFRSQDDADMNSDLGAPIEEYVTALRYLRPICMHLIRSSDDFGAMSPLKFTRENWKDHIREIDLTLFNYRHRHDENQPRFRPVALQGAEESDESSDEQEDMMTYKGKGRLDARLESLSAALTSLPRCKQDEEDLVISDKVAIKPCDRLQVRLPEVHRCAIGVVKRVREMEGLFVSYDDLPTEFDEFLPISQVRSASFAALSVSSTLLRPAIWGNQTSQQKVRCIPSGSSKHHDAIVLRRRKGTFYCVTLTLSSECCIQRWMTREMIIRKVK